MAPLLVTAVFVQLDLFDDRLGAGGLGPQGVLPFDWKDLLRFKESLVHSRLSRKDYGTESPLMSAKGVHHVDHLGIVAKGRSVEEG